MRINDRITGFNGVAPSGVATVELPTGRRYHALYLYYKGTAAQATIEADITFIRLFVNGVQIRDINVAELNKINIANGKPFILGEIPIFFSEPWRATVMGEEATSWDTFGQSSFTVQVGIGAGAVSPTIAGYASFDYQRNDGQNGRTGANIIKWIRTTIVAAGAGAIDVKTLPKGIIQRLSVFGPTSAPTAIQVTLNSRVQMDLSLTEVTNLLAKYWITAQALQFPAWFDHTQQITDALAVAPADDYNVKVTAGAAQNYSVVSEVRVPGYL
jgi:hypothetical protein